MAYFDESQPMYDRAGKVFADLVVTIITVFILVLLATRFV